MTRRVSETNRIEAFSDGVFAIAICFNLLWRSASRNGRLLHEDHDRDAVRHISESYRFGPLSYVVALALAFLSVTASLLLNLALAIYFALPPRTAAAISPRHPERQRI